MFPNRREAGRRLARRLLFFRSEDPLVLGLPRGGVVVAAEVADALGAVLDVLVVRRLEVPAAPELAFGALAPDGVRYVDEDLVREAELSPAAVRVVLASASAQLARRLARFRGDRPPLDVRNRTVLLVDDGTATVATAKAAVRWLRERGPRRLVLAAPVAVRQVADTLRREVDLFVALETQDGPGAVGTWYQEFERVTDDHVVALLGRAARRSQSPASRRA